MKELQTRINSPENEIELSLPFEEKMEDVTLTLSTFTNLNGQEQVKYKYVILGHELNTNKRLFKSELDRFKEIYKQI